MFHDDVLASAIRKVEQRYRLGHTQNLYLSLAYSIEERYELPPDLHGGRKEALRAAASKSAA